MLYMIKKLTFSLLEWHDVLVERHDFSSKNGWEYLKLRRWE